MESPKVNPWTNSEVHTFLNLLGDARIQCDLDASTRNEQIYREIANIMSNHGFTRTSSQCRNKLKKLKCDYWAVKNHNSRNGSKRRIWRWFDRMDAIYGHRPSSSARQGTLDSSPSSLDTFAQDSPSTSDLFSSQATHSEDCRSASSPPSCQQPAASPAPAPQTSPEPVPQALPAPAAQASPACSTGSQHRPTSAKRKRFTSGAELMSALQEMSRVDEELLDQRKAEFLKNIDQMDRAIAMNERMLLLNERVFEQNQAAKEQELAVSKRICDIEESFQQAVLELKRDELRQNAAFLSLMSNLFNSEQKRT